jgi:hypothetical protein
MHEDRGLAGRTDFRHPTGPDVRCTGARWSSRSGGSTTGSKDRCPQVIFEFDLALDAVVEAETQDVTVERLDTEKCARVVEAGSWLAQQQSQFLPCQLSMPSFAAMAAITRAAAGSAHHQPASALASSPTSSATER